MIINWTIMQLDCKPETSQGSNYVVTAHWKCIGEDENFIGQVYSTCEFPVIQNDPFIPYNQLTQEQVLEWCWNNGVDRNAVEAVVIKQIDDQRNPPVISPNLPWNT